MANKGIVTLNPNMPTPNWPRIVRLQIDWTADASGNVQYAIPHLNGTILNVEQIPGTLGDQPTDQYDVTLLNASGIDALCGTGANLSSAAAAAFVPTIGSTGLPPVLAETVTLVVQNAGANKKGSTVLKLR